MKTTVGIVAPADDTHALVVKDRIEARHGATCHILPGNALAVAGGLSWSSDGQMSHLRSASGEDVDVAALDACWFRRGPWTQILPEAADPEYAPQIHAAGEAAVLGLLLDEFRGAWVNHPIAARSAENKL